MFRSETSSDIQFLLLSQGKVISLRVLQNDMGSEKLDLTFLGESFLISVLYLGAIVSGLVSLTLVKICPCMNGSFRLMFL